MGLIQGELEVGRHKRMWKGGPERVVRCGEEWKGVCGGGLDDKEGEEDMSTERV
jgi:hypothetical protein